MVYRVDISDTVEGPIRTLGKMGTPQIAEHNDVATWAKLFEQTTFTARERDAFRHRMAHMIGCVWCANLRSGSLLVDSETGGAQDSPRTAGIPDEFYDNIFDSSWAGYTERERIIIQLVERFAADNNALRDDEEFWQNVHRHFTEDEIVDICYHMIGPHLGRSLMAKVLLGYKELCEVVPNQVSAATNS